MIRPLDRVAVGVVVVALAASGACSSDGRELAEPVFPPPAATTTTTTTTASATAPATIVVPTELPAEPTEPTVVSTTTTAGSSGRVVFDRLHSPANATAEVTGRGAVPGDPVTVDGEPADLLTFAIAADAFTARVWIEDEGAHTVCIADTCGRVFTLAPDAETAEEVVAKIEDAIVLATEIFPYDEVFPGWTIEIGGALSGTGGSTDAERGIVTIYRNRGRSVDDFVRTILHEFGHVVDTERLDDEARARYLTVAGYPTGTEWRAADARRLDDWARQPSEDFAEVLVAAWSERRWLPRTRAEVSDDLLAATLELAGFELSDFGARS